MKPISLSLSITSLLLSNYANAATLPTSSSDNVETRDFRIPTSYESAVLGRRILALTPLGNIATVFPDDSNKTSSSEKRPSNLGGSPLSLIEYIADCESEGNPTILALRISSAFKNIAAGSNVSLSLAWTPPHPPAKRIQSSSWFSSLFSSRHHHHKEPVPYSAANLPRFSLHGWIEAIPAADEKGSDIAKCFVDIHQDAKYWLPGNRIHEAHFVRLVVEHVYWVGGFGDRAYIGWIDKEEWSKVKKEEWEAVRLPGEKKGWKEWSVEDL
ncbi:pyridoxamine 5'-phosphate oxidase-domain-containing protein [Podospora fimiseda]|uniref:Pyridoxamine 5'-phosphate oxidase-domain-containing protein n=1 Tax=Podospora fimiseda TaxID=252190 RepID=A0AAN7H198_9PEZI|nr:pyridoxamine 5'-phosphate oxidase-domain-containing protein [Podospora fimiseda]